MTTSAIPAITPDLIREHGLTPDEYEKIKQLLGGREPTIAELGIFRVMLSEHCSYKSSLLHLKRYCERCHLEVAAPSESARLLDIEGGLAFAFNIPSLNY